MAPSAVRMARSSPRDSAIVMPVGDRGRTAIPPVSTPARASSASMKFPAASSPIAATSATRSPSRAAATGSPGGKAGDQVFAKVEPCGDAIVGLFNPTTKRSSSPVTISTTAAALGLPADANGYQVQDLWGSQSTVVGGQSTFDISSAGQISAQVPAEGVALYRGYPALV